MNLIIKGIQIPAYIMHFILGLHRLHECLGHRLLWAVLIDLLTILLTGISSIGCRIRMRKERLGSPAGCHLHGDRMFYLLCGCGDRHCVRLWKPCTLLPESQSHEPCKKVEWNTDGRLRTSETGSLIFIRRQPFMK